MHFINIYGIIISTLGALLIYILKDKTKLVDRLLFSFFAIFISKYVIELIIDNFNNLILSNLSTSISLVKYVFFFLYLKYMTSDQKKLNKKDLLFFLPSNILLFYMIIVKYDFENSFVNPNIHFVLINYMLLFYMLGFSFLSFKFLKKHHNALKYYYSFESVKINLIWVAVILIYDVVIHIVNMVWDFISTEGISEHYAQVGTFYRFAETISILLFMIFCVWQNNISPPLITKLVSQKEATEKLKSYAELLKNHMKKKKPYLDKDLSIDSLANQLDVKRQDLSEVINFYLNTNFFNYIKEHRVNHVIELMKEDNSENIKLLYLAYDSGFNSKSAFNRAFKEITRKTPSEYLKQVKI